jgi:hypothetical protein
MTGRHLLLLKYLGWYEKSFFPPPHKKRKDVKVDKVAPLLTEAA